MTECSSYTEWRICGDDLSRGPWQGDWNRRPRTKNDDWNAQQYAKRNESVWIEQREVYLEIGETQRTTVEAPKARR